jgi:hypothetical protein
MIGFVVAVTSRSLDQIRDDLALGAVRLDEAVIELADANRVEDVAALLVARVSLAPEDAALSLEGAPERPAALLCRAAGLGINGYSAVLRMRCRNRQTAFSASGALLSAYLALPRPSPTELAAQLSPSGRFAENGA